MPEYDLSEQKGDVVVMKKPDLMEIMKAAVEKVNLEAVGEEEPLVWPETAGKPEVTPLEKAISMAVSAHRGQVDKAGASYILHPLRVMFQMKTEDEMIAAVLHDVIEDTDITLENLKTHGFDRDILEAVSSVTRRDGETYEEFTIRAGLHPMGAKIKCADIADNMDLGRIASVTDRDLKRIGKYHRSLVALKKLEKIRNTPVEVDYYGKGGGTRTARVVLVPRGFSYPHALNAYGSAGTIVIDFDGIDSHAVMPEDFLSLRNILISEDPSTLYGFHAVWAPFFCPECGECYSYGEWNMDLNGYGMCPRGHGRKIENR